MSGVGDGDVDTIAFCWRLERRDGICLGFTTHDRNLAIDGLCYRAAPGMLPSAIALSDGFDPDTLDVRGALTSGALSAAELAASCWDGAAVTIFAVDWTSPADSQVRLARGVLGEVSVAGSGFTAELSGPTAALDRAVVERTSPECRAMLGDRRCRVDMAGRVIMTRVVAAIDDDIIEVADAAVALGAYAYGRLRWISGANSGLASAIRSSSGLGLTLREPPPFAVAVGDFIELSEGCDKAFETCRDRFGNAANFRGEPHLPGMDLLTRYGQA